MRFPLGKGPAMAKPGEIEPSDEFPADSLGAHISSGRSTRLKFALAAAIGQRAEVELANGALWQGVLHHAIEDREKRVLLGFKVAKPLRDEQGNPIRSKKHHEFATVRADKVRKVTIPDVGLSEFAVGGVNQDGANLGGQERELVRWGEDEPPEHLTLAKEGNLPGSKGEWDQFEANKSLFGVETTYDETHYTTKVDERRASISAADAERIAREMGEGKTSDVDELAEKGAADEESAFSSVARSDHLPSDHDDTHRKGGQEQSNSLKAGSKLNPNAKSFTPNPNASPFIPSSRQHQQTPAPPTEQGRFIQPQPQPQPQPPPPAAMPVMSPMQVPFYGQAMPAFQPYAGPVPHHQGGGGRVGDRRQHQHGQRK